MDKSRRVLFHLEQDVLPIDEMQTCIEEFFSLVQTASDDCLGDLKWYAEIQRGSVALATYPSSDTESDEDIDRCLSAMGQDFELIKNGKQPEFLGPEALRHYTRITRLFKTDKGLSWNPTIVVNFPGSINSDPIAMVDYAAPSVTAAVSRSFGTAYGEVKSLSATGRPFFALYDETSGKRMKVYYADELLDTVRACYRSYVRVTGDITFNENGTKRDMTAHDIQVVSRPENTSFAALFGILGGSK